MKVIRPSVPQVTAIVQAMQAVMTAEGRIPLLQIEVESIAAIQRHLLHQVDPIETHGQTLPRDLATVIVDPDMRLETVRILTLLPIIDQQVLAEKVAVVKAAAQCLDIEDRGLFILDEAVRRRHKRIALSIMARAVAHYWSPTGKARLRDWLDMVRIMLPPNSRHLCCADR